MENLRGTIMPVAVIVDTKNAPHPLKPPQLKGVVMCEQILATSSD